MSFHPRNVVGNQRLRAEFRTVDIDVHREEIMQILDNQGLEENSVKPILSVADFCDRYRLDEEEQTRLRKLFGDFASRHELLMNAQRKPVFR